MSIHEKILKIYKDFNFNELEQQFELSKIKKAKELARTFNLRQVNFYDDNGDYAATNKTMPIECELIFEGNRIVKMTMLSFMSKQMQKCKFYLNESSSDKH